MKSACISILLLLFLAATGFANAQSSEGISCWQCPVCGTVFSLSLDEAANVDPYSLCPACGLSYAGYFVPVSCPGFGYDDRNSWGTELDIESESAQETAGIKDPENVLPPKIPQGSSSPDPEVSSADSPAPIKILMVVPQKDYQEEELKTPFDYFQSRGYQVVLASQGVKTATGMSGGSVSIEKDLNQVDVSEFQAVVFVGGEGIYSLRLHEDQDYQKLAQQAALQNKLVGAICLAPWILADAGLLQGVRATASETDHLKSRGAIVEEQDVVVDGKVITASGPAAAEQFARAVVQALEPETSAGQETLNNENSAGSPKYQCPNCAYIYDPAQGDPESGIASKTPFEQLPSTWKCPWCGAKKSLFAKA